MRDAFYSHPLHPCATQQPLTARLLQGPPGTTCPPSLLQRSTPRSQLQTQRAMFSSTRHLCRVFGCPPGLRPSTPRSSSRTSTHRAIAPFALPRHGPRKEEPPFTDGRFDALASCLVERLRVREGGVVGTLSALKANNPQGDLVQVFRTESPSNTRTTGSQSPRPFNMRTFRLIGAVFLSFNCGSKRCVCSSH